MTPGAAIFIIAHHLVRELIEAATDDTGLIWEQIPDVGEDDMKAIVSLMAGIATSHEVSAREFEVATAVLAARAGEPS